MSQTDWIIRRVDFTTGRTAPRGQLKRRSSDPDFEGLADANIAPPVLTKHTRG